MEKNRDKVVLDTNILVSAIVFEGKPAKLLELAREKHFITYTSNFLVNELEETLSKKFNFTDTRIKQIDKMLKKVFRIVYPKRQVFIIRDSDDNRVLEAALEGNCQYIVTGDSDLLDLGTFEDITILTARQYLEILEKS